MGAAGRPPATMLTHRCRPWLRLCPGGRAQARRGPRGRERPENPRRARVEVGGPNRREAATPRHPHALTDANHYEVHAVGRARARCGSRGAGRGWRRALEKFPSPAARLRANRAQACTVESIVDILHDGKCPSGGGGQRFERGRDFQVVPPRISARPLAASPTRVQPPFSHATR